MKNSSLFAIAISLFGLAGATGCSTTTRSLTATAWIAPPGAAPAEGAPAAASGGIKSQYYLTYWEGSCTSMMGCGRGDTKVKRCKVQPDNSVTCVDEPDATKALQPN